MTTARAAVLVLFVAVAATFVWVWRGSGGPTPAGSAANGDTPAAVAPGPIDFPPYTPNADALVVAWDRERAEPLPMDDATSALLDAWHRDNFATGVGARGLFEGDAGALRSDFERRLRDWTAVRDPSDFLRLSWVAYERFEAATTELLLFTRTTDSSLESLLGDPLLTQVHAYYESGGAFLDGAVEAGLVTDGGELNAPPELLVVLFRYNWVWRAQAIYPVERTLPGPDLREFTRWRLEDAGLPLERRLDLISTYEQQFGFTDYPAAFARAVAYADAGQPDDARAALAEALEAAPDNTAVAGAAATMGLR